MNLNACEITAAVTAVANALAGELSDDELDIMAAVFMQLADTLATIAVYRNVCENINNNCGENDDEEC